MHILRIYLFTDNSLYMALNNRLILLSIETDEFYLFPLKGIYKIYNSLIPPLPFFSFFLSEPYNLNLR